MAVSKNVAIVKFDKLFLKKTFIFFSITKIHSIKLIYYNANLYCYIFMYLNLNTRQSSKAFKDQTSSLSMNLKKNSKKLTTKIKSSILYIKTF